MEYEHARFLSLRLSQTDNGSALHEAALFGKMDVVRLLLDSGQYLLCPGMWELFYIFCLERKARLFLLSVQLSLLFTSSNVSFWWHHQNELQGSCLIKEEHINTNVKEASTHSCVCVCVWVKLLLSFDISASHHLFFCSTSRFLQDFLWLEPALLASILLTSMTNTDLCMRFGLN